jgi:hypothetical protein
MQAVHDVTDSRYPAEEQDLITLAALQCEQEHGDYSDGHSHFEDGLDHYLPATLLNQVQYTIQHAPSTPLYSPYTILMTGPGRGAGGADQ